MKLTWINKTHSAASFERSAEIAIYKSSVEKLLHASGT